MADEVLASKTACLEKTIWFYYRDVRVSVSVSVVLVPVVENIRSNFNDVTQAAPKPDFRLKT